MKTEKDFIHDTALRILKQTQQIWDKEHSFKIVSVNNFTHLDLAYYKRIENELLAIGFTKLADIEDIAVKDTKPDPRTFLRILVSQDKTVSAAIYHAKPKFPWPLLCWLFKITPLKVFELGSDFKNNISLTTTIVSSKTKADGPDTVVRQYIDKKTSVEQAYTIHIQKRNSIVNEHQTEPELFSSLDTLCELQNRTILLIRKYMEDIGWVSKEYLIRQYGKNTKFIDDVYGEVQRIVKNQLITGELR